MRRKIAKSVGADKRYVKACFDDFIEQKSAQGLSQSTLDNYEYSFSFLYNYQNWTEDTEITVINESLFYKLINYCKNQEMKATTINHYLRDLRTFVYWCQDKEYIEPFNIKLIEAQEDSIKFFTDEEIESLLVKPSRNAGFVEWRTWTIVNFVMATGARAATICDLHIEDLDFQNNTIKYRHTKNKKAQVVPMSNALAGVLKEYMRTFKLPLTGYVFPNVGAEKMTTNALRLSFTRYCEDRGVDKSSIHGLRHSFARGWILNDGGVYQLQQILGHSTVDMTRRYVKLFGEDLKEGYESFSPLDQMKKKKSRTKKIES